MNDVVVGVIFGLSVSIFFITVIYLLADLKRLRIIKFKVDGNDYWEIAFSEKELHARMNGRTGEVQMPAKPIIIRWYRYFFPLKGRNI